MNKEEDKKQDKVEIGKKMRLDDKGGDEKEMKKERKKGNIRPGYTAQLRPNRIAQRRRNCDLGRDPCIQKGVLQRVTQRLLGSCITFCVASIKFFPE